MLFEPMVLEMVHIETCKVVGIGVDTEARIVADTGVDTGADMEEGMEGADVECSWKRCSKVTQTQSA